MSRQLSLFQTIFIYIITGWSVLVFCFMGFAVWQEFITARYLAHNEALVSVKKDLAYRTWVSSHGGVYVPVTEHTPPNPYLSHIKNRDIITLDGKKLTLMNPAYTLRQMMEDYSKLYGDKAKITSNILLNPINQPDDWERRALQIVEKSREAYYEIQTIDDEQYLRLLNPLITEQSCLKCHGFQGYKVGDLRGGVSVAILLKPYYHQAMQKSWPIIARYFILWLLGAGGLWFGKKKARQFIDERIRYYEQNIYSLVDMIEKRDSYTAGHSRRVAEYAMLLAGELGYEEEQVKLLGRACMLHDIGKISTPDSILLKPGRLSSLEFSIIQQHVTSSYDLLRNIDIYHDIAEIVRHHHERYDGSGYPQGLDGGKIPMLSQIMAVADAFDAMTTDRVYKGRKDIPSALREIDALSGKQFHPEVAHAAQKVLADVTIHDTAGQLPKTQLEEERFAYFYKDQITQLYNREYLDFILSKNSNEQFGYRYIIAACLHDFTRYNKTFGWKAGDAKLKEIAQALTKAAEGSPVFRIFGDDFVILSRNRQDAIAQHPLVQQSLEGSSVTISTRIFDLEEQQMENVDALETLL